MAETVGVVAAAVEFGRLVVELKGLCSSIKRAPKDLSELLEELDIAEKILQACADQQTLVSSYASPSLLQTCRQSCEKAVRDLKYVCSELIACVERSRWYGSVKSVLKKDMLERSRHKVERAKLNLLVAQESLSLTLHTLHFQQHTNTQALIQTTSLRLSSLLVAEEQVQRVDQQVAPSAVAPAATMSENRNPNVTMAPMSQIARSRQCSKKLQTRRLLIFQSRLLGKRFELIQQHAYGGWMYGYRTYSVRPCDSPVFEYVTKGDAIGLQQLFQTKQASIYDRDQCGLTLLHHATEGADPPPEMIQFLMQCGADPTVTDNFGRLPLETVVQRMKLGVQRPTIGQLREVVNVLTSDYLLEELLTSLPRSLSLCHFVIPRLVPHIIQVVSPPWATRDFETRLKAAYDACVQGQASAAFWLCLSQPHLDSLCLVRRGKDKNEVIRYESLVERLAHLMGGYLQSKHLLPDYGGWRSVLHAAVSLGGLQAAFEHGCRSLMLYYIFMAGRSRAGNSPAAYFTSRRLTYRIQQWAYEIRLAGQDLLEYGKLEEQYLDRFKGKAVPMYRCSIFRSNKDDGGVVYLDNFVYGKSPNDWKMWVATSVDEATREFWEMVEEETDPLPRVPGAWPDTVPHSSAHLNHREWEFTKRLRRRYLRYMGLTQDQHDEIFPNWRKCVEEKGYEKKRKEDQDRFFKETGLTSWRSFELEYQKGQRAPR